MSVKEWIIKKMAIKMVISEKVIDSVVTHQFDSANDALNTCKSVELSGFGKFYFNEKKAIKTMEKYLSQKDMYETVLADETTSDQKRANVQVRLANLLISIKTLKPKIDESRTDI
jgi:nucleoid DNA-binding protein